ncbi:Gfo/Idh/MocA family protein [Sinorhizobium meliloti]|uniref:Gfo/Idh/MocA family protein n=1 Tax=Rhizobium meliloti TaxID=382 RepID=UPI000FD3A649|nr:Gfo/Idh/MocA family oxidoreductase [Sinorhizobium meliloti]MQV24832.1 gfo/Idh/MocA family oxidoreductase [Sinorhizobium meliloti]MQV37498.1 gfo/Idh/MocA family oxidoreductase [Sinorhizobium meliloti]RVE79204.1 gfo/Idh/MocA family oxidoreductase [Sinorhizobium meliloti]RVG42722.1 gfo/Idh/MocA family oxidoreductase [Sinorhizobium meliloti]RVM08317.1 gfo/Idh/MocA family oxidoreductase [Sinorhizobium meliloti]
MAPIQVGLVGAGPWADIFHAPMMASGPETALSAIWARQPEAAKRLAAKHGAKVAGTFDELLEMCDAVVFAVPPNVQAEFVPRAAAAGKALLLEKPLGLDVKEAERVANAVNDSGVVNQIMLTNRYSTRVRSFLKDVRAQQPLGAVATYINGAILPGGLFATPWRVDKGSLLDLGPHVIDIFDAALGPVVDIHGAGDPRKWFAITLRHESGAVSQAALSLATPVEGEVTGVRVFTDKGEVTMDFVGAFGDPNAPATIRSEFAASISARKPHEINVNRALYLQRLLDRAARSAGL